jgi:hypothetical protein
LEHVSHIKAKGDGGRGALHPYTIQSAVEFGQFLSTVTGNATSPRTHKRTDKHAGSEHISAAVAADQLELNRRSRTKLPAPDNDGKPASRVSRLDQMLEAAKVSRGARERQDETAAADGEDDRVHMIVDAKKTGADGLYYSNRPTAYYGIPVAGAWPMTRRGAPRIKVHNGTVVVGKLSKEHRGGWLELTGRQTGYWLPVVAGGFVVLQRVPDDEVQVLGAWKIERGRKFMRNQQEVDRLARKAREDEERELKHKQARAAQQQRLESRLELDDDAYWKAHDEEMQIAVVKIQSLQRGRATRRQLAEKHEQQRRDREEAYRQIESATKIQAVYRGRRDRKKTSRLRVAAQLARIHGMMAVQARPKPHIKRSAEATQAARAAIEQALSGGANPDGFVKAPPPAVVTSKVAVLPLPAPPAKASKATKPKPTAKTVAQVPLHKQVLAETLPLPVKAKPPLPATTPTSPTSPSKRRHLPMNELAKEQRERANSPSPQKSMPTSVSPSAKSLNDFPRQTTKPKPLGALPGKRSLNDFPRPGSPAGPARGKSLPPLPSKSAKRQAAQDAEQEYTITRVAGSPLIREARPVPSRLLVQ